MTREPGDASLIPAAQRLRALLPPSAGIPLNGMSLARPDRCRKPSTDRPVALDQLDPALAAFAAGWRDPEPRAVATQFSKYWFRAAIPPVLVCAAVGRVAPSSALADLKLDTDGSGIPHLVVPDDPAIGDTPADGEAVLEHLFAVQLDQVVALLSKRSRLAPRVFWSNAANVLAWYLDQLRECPDLQAGAAALAARWSDSAAHPRFRGHNPLHMPRAANPEAGVDVAGSSIGRRRRICCARYLSADWELCETCPLNSAPAARTAKR